MPSPTFPTTPILDDFNTGAAQNLTARTGWNAGVLTVGDTTMVTDATPTKAVAATTTKSNYWNTQALNTEAYVQIANSTPASGEIELLTRITAVGASLTAYFLRIYSGSSTEFTLARWVAGAGALIGTNKVVTTVAGDSIGIRVVGNVVTSWYQSGAGAWVLKDTVVDSNVTGPGFFAGIINRNSASPGFDQIGGGPTSPSELSMLGAGF